jgi:hypothetical protein
MSELLVVDVLVGPLPELAPLDPEKKVVVLTDLDDTLFQTFRKSVLRLPPPGRSPLHAATLGQEDQPISFMTPAQKILLFELFKGAWVIPVTGRSLPAYGRVAVKFGRGAILNHGATILKPDGREDLEWRGYIAPKSLAAEKLLKKAEAKVQRLVQKWDLPVKTSLKAEGGLPLYLSCRAKGTPERGCDDSLYVIYEAVRRGLEEELDIYQNPGNLVFIPPHLGKAPAAARFLEAHVPWPRSSYLLVGLGDSYSDREFLKLCDFRMSPSGTQLAPPVRPPASR